MGKPEVRNSTSGFFNMLLFGSRVETLFALGVTSKVAPVIHRIQSL